MSALLCPTTCEPCLRVAHGKHQTHAAALRLLHPLRHLRFYPHDLRPVHRLGPDHLRARSDNCDSRRKYQRYRGNREAQLCPVIAPAPQRQGSKSSQQRGTNCRAPLPWLTEHEPSTNPGGEEDGQPRAAIKARITQKSLEYTSDTGQVGATAPMALHCSIDCRRPITDGYLRNSRAAH
jgi:hypothetical protein